MRRRAARAVFALAVTSALSGCSLLSSGPPVDERWFSPESLDVATPRKAVTPGTGKLALGRVSSSALLRNHIVFRRSDVELGTYDDIKWSDYPEAYVRHALLRVLFETNRFAAASGPGVPTLDVDVIGFEEVRRGPSRSGRVQMSYEIRDGDTILSSGVVTAERAAAAGTDIGQVVRAIASALDDATTRLADAAQDSLAASASPASAARFAMPPPAR
jgi:ABC-type uncharacterized transport system auxiliary subunit